MSLKVTKLLENNRLPVTLINFAMCNNGHIIYVFGARSLTIGDTFWGDVYEINGINYKL